MERIHKVAFLISITLPLGLLQYNETYCKQILRGFNFQDCCKMPRLIPDDVFLRCENRSLPPSLPGEPDPLPAQCQAECVLNETGILLNHQFHIEQAIKVLLEQVPNGILLWKHTFEVAARKCYKSQVVEPFYLGNVAKNLISSQCIPSSLKFLECMFTKAYKTCPDVHWDFSNERCDVENALNNCRYLFLHVWKI